jgi:phage-related holin
VPYWTGNGQILSQSWPWENSEGPWQAGNVILRSQENNLYDNGDSTLSTQWMESEFVDISGTNRVVVSVNHKFETEWDNDILYISVMDTHDNVLGQKRWSGDRWLDYQTDFITAVSDSTFTQVKVRLDFIPDQTVNYRGWELQSLTLFSILDEYLDIVESSGTISPKIPMTITGIYPNPSHGRFQLDIANYPGGNGSIRIFNILGQEIKSFDLQKLSAGRHYFDLNLNNINGRPMSSGMVFVRVESGNEQLVKKFIILKK